MIIFNLKKMFQHKVTFMKVKKDVIIQLKNTHGNNQSEYQFLYT